MKAKYVVLLNAGREDELVDSRHATYTSAMCRVRSIAACGDKADIAKIDTDGNYTFDF